MVANQAIRSCIRENKAHQIYSLIQTGGKYGMRTMNQALFEVYSQNAITYDEAMSRTTDPEDLKRTFQRGGGAGGQAPGSRRASGSLAGR